MHFHSKQTHFFHIFSLLFLFGLFAVLSLLVTLLGANAYRQTVNRLNKNDDFQNLNTYFTEKIQEVTSRSSIQICNKKDTDILAINDGSRNTPHYTCVYLFEDQLCELSLSSLQSFCPTDGSELLPASDFSVKAYSHQLYKLTVTDLQNEAYEFYITIHASGK